MTVAVSVTSRLPHHQTVSQADHSPRSKVCKHLILRPPISPGLRRQPCGSCFISTYHVLAERVNNLRAAAPKIGTLAQR